MNSNIKKRNKYVKPTIKVKILKSLYFKNINNSHLIDDQLLACDRYGRSCFVCFC